jgi:deoxyribodipyrimidine photo-lyase
MADTALVWIRRDLRLADHPPLSAALAEHARVVPVFCLDPRLVRGRFPSPARTGFLLESLAELAAGLRERGGCLAFRCGRPHEELPRLAREVGASAAYLASDVSPYARARDRAARAALERAGVRVVHTPGNFVADVGAPRTRDGRPFTVFSPFHRAWRELSRRDVLLAPDEVPVPSGLRAGRLPGLADLGFEPELPDPLPAGEAAGRTRLDEFMDGPISRYADNHDRLAGGTSVLSPYLHFGCVSAREVEQRAGEAGRGRGPSAFRRQLAWRDFYAHVLLHNPRNAVAPHHDRFEALEWDRNAERLAAWKEGRTGFPVVDAAMRQLRTMGWMHNRARLVVGSFLTKDLHLDWREGEAHFMRYLLCGDEAQNNGNWQWIAGTGVDPQPFFRRMYNPTLHQRRYDADGEYVRRWVPELRDVPLERLAEPWTMDEAEQEAAGCLIGRDYPAPIVDHAAERREAMERYKRVA